jgi:Fe-S-cluster containining protein
VDQAGPSAALVFDLKEDSPFFFKCQVCSVCCSNKAIRIGPYEALRLARSLGIATTQFLQTYTEEGHSVLRNKPDGSCILLDSRGCGVHPDRPLVCRLFPLGQLIDERGSARFSVMPLHPDCLGLVDTDGTVSSYLESQGALPYFTYDRIYSALQKRILGKVFALEPAPGSLLTLWADIDAALAAWGQAASARGTHDVEALVKLHIRTLEEWTGRP